MIKLFCIPYAGGSASNYAGWISSFSPEIEIVPVELAGRGKRIYEPFYSNLDEAVDDVYKIIQEERSDIPYALFGHSMGGLIAYKVAQRIMMSGTEQPQHLFFSGKSAPNISSRREFKYHLLDDDQFKDEIMKLGGTPDGFFEYPALVQLFLPLLKNDFRIAETEVFNDGHKPFNIDISVLFGKDDSIDFEQMEGWKSLTSKKCNVYYFEGGHFFIHDNTRSVIEIVDNNLMAALVNNYL